MVIQMKNRVWDSLSAIAEATTNDTDENRRRRRDTVVKLLEHRLTELGYLKPEKEKEAPVEPQS